MAVVTIILSLAVVASVVAFLLLWHDKRAAERGGRRISERTLHTWEFLGGWPGSLAAQQLVRHKTAKLRYRVVFWLVACAHVAIAGTIALIALR